MKSVLFVVVVGLAAFAVRTWASGDTHAVTEGHEMYDEKEFEKMHQAWMNPDQDNREKMAQLHAEMATCLRSSKDFMTCHDDFNEKSFALMSESCPGLNSKQDQPASSKSKN